MFESKDEGINPIEEANQKNDELNNPKSAIQPGLNTSHQLPLTDDEKQAKAMMLIDEIVTEKLKPIEAQLKELPGLIQNTVKDILVQLSNQQVQPDAQPISQAGQADNMQAIATLLQAVAPIFGKGETQQNPLMDMIVQSYMKRMQMDIDAQFMNTYQTPVNPPTWPREAIQKPKVQVE